MGATVTVTDAAADVPGADEGENETQSFPALVQGQSADGVVTVTVVEPPEISTALVVGLIAYVQAVKLARTDRGASIRTFCGVAAPDKSPEKPVK